MSMQMTVGQASDKIKDMRNIVNDIESGVSVENRLYDISLYLDEYIAVLCNTKINV